MLISDLDYLLSVNASSTASQAIRGGNSSREVSLSIINDQLSLKLNGTVVLERPFNQTFEFPKTVSFDSDQTSFVVSSSAVQTINGVSQGTASITVKLPSKRSRWRRRF